MRNIFIIFSLFGLISGIYADDKKAITLTHIGEQDAIIPIIIINTYKDGLELDRNQVLLFYDYYLVQESTFDEIINLINTNIELFGEREWLQEHNGFRIYSYGTFELFIENEGEEYYYSLIDRRSSALFFSILYNLIVEKEDNIKLIKKLESQFDYFHFYLHIPEIGYEN
jgi:hypothetical protein